MSRPRGAAWRLVLAFILCGAAALLFSSIASFAQETTGTILGRVTDPQGSVVPGALVTATDTDSGLTRTVPTGDDGAYRLPSLPVGNYSIRVTKEGFQTNERNGLTLEVAQEAVVNFTMAVGSVTQTVTVTEAAPLVDTTSSSVGGTVNEERVTDLPLNGRNWTDLTLMQAGVSKVNILTGNAALPGLNGTFYSSNGTTIQSNMYLLDGADERTYTGFNNTSVINTALGVDGIKEYKVVSILPDASYGLAMGSQTTVVSKGGTNQFHGDAFDYLRNASLDARNYFDALDTKNTLGFGTDKSIAYPGKRIPPFRRNNFGGAFGGPIQKDRTFFYGVFEGIQQQLGLTETKTTLPAACFVNGAIPAVITNSACVSTASTSTPLAVNPFILPLASVYPEPNVTGYPFNYTFPYLQPATERYGQIRVDRNFSSSDSGFFRYTQDDSDTTYPYNFLAFPIILHGASQFATLSETHIFSPVLLNNARLSFSRTVSTILNGPEPAQYTTPNLLLVSAANQAAAPGNPEPGVFAPLSPGSGVTGIGSDIDNQHANQDVFTLSDDVFWAKGKHAFKFGTLMNRFLIFNAQFGYDAGQANFSSLANFFVGNYSLWSVVTPGSNVLRDVVNNTFGFYAQDDYRATSRLTLNLGLRYEFTTVPQDTNPALRCTIRNAVTSETCTPGPLFVNPSLHNFSPRIGFAWDVFGNGKTSVRGGAGLYYDVGNYGLLSTQYSASDPPISGILQINNTAAAPPYAFTVPFTTTFANNVPLAPRVTEYNLRQPASLQRSLTIDQQLPWQMGITVSYVGNQAWDLWQIRDQNPTPALATSPNGLPIYGCWNAAQTQHVSPGTNGACAAGFSTNGPKVNPLNGQAQLNQTEGNAYYNALQIQLNKRVTKGLEFQFNYTWSKLEDDGTGIAVVQALATNNWQVPNGYNTLLDRGLSVYNVPSNIRANVMYHAPNIQGDGILSKFANGWWFSSIIAAQSGYPVTPILGSDRSLQNALYQDIRPNYSPSYNPATIVKGTPAQWFDPTMFSLQPAGMLGDAGRGILSGPGYSDVDFSIVKDTKAAFLGEAGNIEFRIETFNLLNHVNFSNPVATVWSASGAVSASPSGQIGTTVNGTAISAFPTAGQISSTVGNSRQIQFALKLLF